MAPAERSAFETGCFELYDRDGDGRASEAEFEQGAAVFGTPRA